MKESLFLWIFGAFAVTLVLMALATFVATLIKTKHKFVLVESGMFFFAGAVDIIL